MCCKVSIILNTFLNLSLTQRLMAKTKTKTQAEPTGQLQKSAFLIGGMTIISSVFGLFRDKLLAHIYGAGDILDIYYASFRLPDLLFNILIYGGLSSAFVPIFSQYVAKNKKEAFQLANSILNLVLIAIISISAICFILAPVLMPLIVPGFSDEKAPGFSRDKLDQTILLTRILLLSPIFLSISGVFSGILMTYKRFFFYSLAPIMYNLGIIVGILILAKKYGIYGLGAAVILGAFLHMLVQLPYAIKCGFRYIFVLNLKSKTVIKIRNLIIPRSMTLLLNQLNLLVITIIGSTLMSGSISAYYLAKNIAEIPLTIFGAPFAIAVFADLAFAYNQQKITKFGRIFTQIFNQIAYFVIPITVLIIILRAQLIRILYGSGNFNWDDTTLTLSILGYLALSLFFQSLLPLLSRAFFAAHDTLTPFISGLIAVGINIGLALFLVGSMGVKGLALAFSISQAVNVTIMLTFLHLKVKKIQDHKIVKTMLKITISALIGGFGAQFIKYISGTYLGTETFLTVLIQAALASLVGLSLYLIISWQLGLRQFQIVYKKVKRIFSAIGIFNNLSS
ncbi:MAG: murein biosynthesis integral membrane protein MurJ [Candidatus Moranbacteria bacterium]|nr:murein biosynthesis integral membrane protein MurJ [Candidatus Moranbacteria bacterium]